MVTVTEVMTIVTPVSGSIGDTAVILVTVQCDISSAMVTLVTLVTAAVAPVTVGEC